jgi:hypothetical protein
MPAYRKAIIHELTSSAYELDLGIAKGRLHRNSENSCWMVGDVQLSEWLAQYDGQQVVLIAASLEDDRPVPSKVCRTCGTEYIGAECPRCREVRTRLRGR